MFSFDTFQAIGLVAGAICTLSILPENIAYMRRVTLPDRLRVLRNVLLAVGNAIWVVYGTLGGLLPVQVFCMISSLLATALAIDQARALRRPADPSPDITSN